MEEARYICSMAIGQDEEQKRSVSGSTKKDKKKVNFASMIDICHLNNAELDLKVPKVLRTSRGRGDIVKDDSGSCVVFTEQGSSASQITAAKVMMDGIARLLIVQEKQPTQYQHTLRQRWRKLPDCSKFPSQNVQTFGHAFHDTEWPKSWTNIEDPVVPLERNLYGHPFAGLLWKDSSGKS